MIKMETWFHNFPSEVQVEIIKRLDIKSLLRLMSTSKSIYSILTSPTLMITESKRDTGYQIYTYCTCGHQRFLLCRDTVKDFKIGKEITSIDIDVNYFLLGSIFGLVCFAKTFHPKDSDVILWNPFLGKSVRLPIPASASEKSFAIGFGFDRSCIDHKIVRVGILPDFNSSIWAEVYVLRAGYWKKVVGSLSRPASRIMGEGVFMNNALHWILIFSSKSCDGQIREEYSILTYNLYTEVFSEMRIEEIMSHRFMVMSTLAINGEEKLILYRDDQCRGFNIWVMEEYGVANSWKEICIMESKDHDHVGEYMKVLHSRKNGEIVLSTTNGRLILCKIGIDDKKSSIRIVKDYEGPHQLDYVGPEVASLVFVDEQRWGGPLSGKRIPMEVDHEHDRAKTTTTRTVLRGDRYQRFKDALIGNLAHSRNLGEEIIGFQW